MRLSRPVRDEMILRKMSENISTANSILIFSSKLIFSILWPQWVHPSCWPVERSVFHHFHQSGRLDSCSVRGLAWYQSKVFSFFKEISASDTLFILFCRLTSLDGQIQNMSREEINLVEVVEDVALQALRRVQINMKWEFLETSFSHWYKSFQAQQHQQLSHLCQTKYVRNEI